MSNVNRYLVFAKLVDTSGHTFPSSSHQGEALEKTIGMYDLSVKARNYLTDAPNDQFVALVETVLNKEQLSGIKGITKVAEFPDTMSRFRNGGWV